MEHLSFLRRYLKKFPAVLVLILLLISGCIIGFSIIVHEVLYEQEVQVDHKVMAAISNNFLDEENTRLMKFFTQLASATFLQIGYGLIVFLYLVRRNFKRAIEIACLGLGGYFLNYVMKEVFRRVRPPDPLIDGLSNFSFPSGHATSAFIFYGLICYLVWKSGWRAPIKWILIIALLLLATLIGFSRIYLRVHYPSDVAAGFCIGLAWLATGIWIMERLKRKEVRE